MTKFILPRVTGNIIEQKEFANLNKDSIKGAIDFPAIDLLKIVLMGLDSPESIPHWISEVAGGMLKLYPKIKQLSFSSSIFLYGFGGSNIKEKLKNFGIIKEDIVEYPPEEYFDYIFSNIKEQKRGGVLKYDKILKAKTQEDIRVAFDKMRYLAYLFTGQLKEGSVWYDVYSFRQPLNFLTPSPFDGLGKRMIKEKLGEIIKNGIFPE